MAKKRLAVLISGRGTNLQSLIDASAAPDWPAEIVLVLSNKADAGGLQRAERAGVATRVLSHRDFGQGEAGRTAFDAAVTAVLEEAQADYVCLAGFMRILTAQFVGRWRGRLINIHPSLLPSFKGLDVHRRMIEAGVKIAGCTVHFVTEEMDAGPIIGQTAVPVRAEDDAESLAARILDEEHRLYPACVRLVASGEATLGDDGVVRFADAQTGAGVLRNPA